MSEATHISVEADPDLFKVRDWLWDIATVRIVETSVGPYGAVDVYGGTLYFDIGDTVVRVLNTVTVVKTYEFNKLEAVAE